MGEGVFIFFSWAFVQLFCLNLHSYASGQSFVVDLVGFHPLAHGTPKRRTKEPWSNGHVSLSFPKTFPTACGARA